MKLSLNRYVFPDVKSTAGAYFEAEVEVSLQNSPSQHFTIKLPILSKGQSYPEQDKTIFKFSDGKALYVIIDGQEYFDSSNKLTLLDLKKISSISCNNAISAISFFATNPTYYYDIELRAEVTNTYGGKSAFKFGIFPAKFESNSKEFNEDSEISSLHRSNTIDRINRTTITEEKYGKAR